MKRRKADIIRELRGHLDTAAFHDLTFFYKDDFALTGVQRRAVEAYVRKAFVLWWNSWIIPLIDDAEVAMKIPKKISDPSGCAAGCTGLPKKRKAARSEVNRCPVCRSPKVGLDTDCVTCAKAVSRG